MASSARRLFESRQDYEARLAAAEVLPPPPPATVTDSPSPSGGGDHPPSALGVDAPAAAVPTFSLPLPEASEAIEAFQARLLQADIPYASWYAAASALNLSIPPNWAPPVIQTGEDAPPTGADSAVVSVQTPADATTSTSPSDSSTSVP